MKVHYATAHLIHHVHASIFKELKPALVLCQYSPAFSFQGPQLHFCLLWFSCYISDFCFHLVFPQGLGGSSGPLGPPGSPGLPVSPLLIQPFIQTLPWQNDSICPISCRVLKVPKDPRVQVWVLSVFLKAFCPYVYVRRVRADMFLCTLFFPGPCGYKRRHWFNWSSWSSCEY